MRCWAKIVTLCACVGWLGTSALEAQAQSGTSNWNSTTAGSGDTYRGPMRASGLPAPGATPAQAAAWPANASYPQSPQAYGTLPPNRAFQPPSVSTFPPLRTGTTGPPAVLPQGYPQQGIPQPGFPAQAFGSPPPYIPPGNNPPGSVGQPYTGQPSVGQPYVPQPNVGQPYVGQPYYPPAGIPGQGTVPPYYPPGGFASPSDYAGTLAPGVTQPGVFPGVAPGVAPPPGNPLAPIAPIDVFIQERQTGRAVIGGTVNSELGVAGQLILEERNFDFRQLTPGGRFLRGGRQHLRIELMPGNEVQRYAVSWAQPNLFERSPTSLSVGGFYYTRNYRDWDEQRAGGRISLGREITRNLSISGEVRAEDVKLFDPRVSGVEELDRSLGSTDLYQGRVRIVRDTRDSTFLTHEGSLLELGIDQGFGEEVFTRGNVSWSRYWTVGRTFDPDASRQTLASSLQLGITSGGTPIFENYYAGGFSTIRGFDFRGASPKESDVEVGGEFLFLGSLEYGLPLTADNMLRTVAFVDYGTVERDVTITSENFRTSVGLGLRISVPAISPAPFALDFAYPVLMADTDDKQIFSFFIGATR